MKILMLFVGFATLLFLVVPACNSNRIDDSGISGSSSVSAASPVPSPPPITRLPPADLPPPDLPPSDLPPDDAPAGAVTATWLGTAGLYVTDGRTSFLIDPFVSRYGMAHVLTRMALEPQLDLIDALIKKLSVPPGTPVLVTHSHYDHALDAPYFAQRLGGKLYGSGSTVFVGLGAGLRAEQMGQVQAGQALTLGDFSIRFMPSCHGPQFAGLEIWTGNIEAPLTQPTSAANYKVGDHYSLAITHPRASFYHQSSACIKAGMYDNVRADTLFLGVSARTSTAGLVDPALQGTGARRIIPIHWDDFFAPLADGPQPGTGSDLDEFRATLRAKYPAVVEKELTFFESITL